MTEHTKTSKDRAFIAECNEVILVVDDDPTFVEMIAETLATVGYKTAKAFSGAEALNVFKQHNVFLVFADMRMPAPDGVDLCRTLKAQSTGLCCILVTAAAEKAVAIAALRAGIDDIIEKPFKESTLIKLADKAASKRRAASEREGQELEQLRQVFLEEAKSITSDLESCIMAMDEPGYRPSDADKLFRKLHTLKGSSGAVQGAEALGRLAHTLESALDKIRSGDEKPSDSLTEAMLQGVDIVSRCLRSLESGGEMPATEVDLFIKAFVANAEQAKNGALHHAGANRDVAGSLVVKSTARMPDAEADEGVHVSSERLDRLMTTVGELVALKNVSVGFARHATFASSAQQAAFEDIAKTISKISEQVQVQLMEVRKVSVGRAMAKFPRVVRQLSQYLKKQIKLETSGAETMVDKAIAKALSDSLIHAVRNACDHGIETPEVRLARGKPAMGKISIAVVEEGDLAVIRMTDDGGGLDEQRIVAKAIKSGLVTREKASTMNRQDIYALLFLPGFSTAEQVTAISGRGVGMDAVMAAVVNLGGRVDIDSVKEQGTTLTLRIPVPKTVMVEQTFIVTSGFIQIAVPVSSVADIAPLASDEVVLVQGRWTCQHRGRNILIGTYDELLDTAKPTKKPEAGQLKVVITHNGRNLAIRVDAVLDQLEAVVRPVSPVIGTLPGFKGTAQLPEDGLAYVLSAESFMDTVFGNGTETTKNGVAAA